MKQIIRFKAREILDSRGIPTLEAEVFLNDGSSGRASVPSGASRGKSEAYERTDNEPNRYQGRGKKRVAESIEGELFDLVRHQDPLDQLHFDQALCAADGEADKSRFGANALLAVSLATAKAAAASCNLELYEYIARLHGRDLNRGYLLPTPMMNVLNGGVHADSGLDIQEFLIIPWGAPSFRESLRWGAEIFQVLKDVLRERKLSVAVGDEGGFSPKINQSKEALDLLATAVVKAGYALGTAVSFGIDAAASQWMSPDGVYELKQEGLRYNSLSLNNYYEEITKSYPLLSIEDGFSEKDWDGFILQTKKIGDKVQIVGDDLFVTNPKLLTRGIECHAGNAVLIKPNQIGTLSETLTTIRIAQSSGYNAIVSHRSGETEDVSLIDLAVATGVGQIKTGSLSRGERIAKYNRLLRIEEQLGSRGEFSGIKPFERFFKPSAIVYPG